MEAITQAGTCVGVLTSEGVILGAQKRVVSKLLETKGQTYVLLIITYPQDFTIEWSLFLTNWL